MRATVAFLIACAVAALAPLWPRPSEAAATATAFPGWPASVDGRPLLPRPLAPRERRFADGFPGRIATFGDGQRLYVLRWVTRATRQLHPAADCLRGAGYEVTPRPLLRDEQGRVWGVTLASRGTTRLQVRERIVDARGGAFSDASSWYWAALFDGDAGPWWAWTVIERDG